MQSNTAQDLSSLRKVCTASRRGSHNENQPSPCKPLRFARCFSPLSCSPQRLAGVGEYKSDEAHAALVAARLLRADQRRLRFLPLGVASHDARPRGSETVRARCGVDARGVDGKGMLFAARLLFRARFWGLRRSNLGSALEWAGQGRCPCIPAQGAALRTCKGTCPLDPFLPAARGRSFNSAYPTEGRSWVRILSGSPRLRAGSTVRWISRYSASRR